MFSQTSRSLFIFKLDDYSNIRSYGVHLSLKMFEGIYVVDLIRFAIKIASIFSHGSSTSKEIFLRDRAPKVVIEGGKSLFFKHQN